MSKWVEQAKVLAQSLVTYAVLVSTVASAVAAVAVVSDGPVAVKVAAVALAVAATANRVVKIVANVTPVPVEKSGVLAPDAFYDRG